MSEPYEEHLEGECWLRLPPGPEHESVCARLHQAFQEGLGSGGPAALLTPRTSVRLAPLTAVRPDLALVTTASGRLWFAAEIIDSADHRVDTVEKKGVYEAFRIPRLWMIDPRYRNVEIYYGGPHGLALKGMFAGRERLTEPLLPDLRITVDELFGA